MDMSAIINVITFHLPRLLERIKQTHKIPLPPFIRGGGGTLPVYFLGAVKVVSFFYAQPAGRISEVLIGIFKGKPMLPFDAG